MKPYIMRDPNLHWTGSLNANETLNNAKVLIDSVVHAVNEDYVNMAGDFQRLGFLGGGVDIGPIVPALENIWKDSMGKSMEVFNFRTVTSKFNELVYQYPIRVPERYALVIRSLLTQEGICMTLDRNFHFLEVHHAPPLSLISSFPFPFSPFPSFPLFPFSPFHLLPFHKSRDCQNSTIIVSSDYLNLPRSMAVFDFVNKSFKVTVFSIYAPAINVFISFLRIIMLIFIYSHLLIVRFSKNLSNSTLQL
jgi:hypothetical protein